MPPSACTVPVGSRFNVCFTANVSLRGGCFCNPGAAEAAFGFWPERVRVCTERLGRDFTIPRFAACLRGPVGAVRASVGVPTTVSDIDRLIQLLDGIHVPD